MVKNDIFEIWCDRVIAQTQRKSAKRSLQGWLEGTGLPPIDNYTEGHTWLLEAARDIPSLKTRLAVLARQLIENCRRHRLRSNNLNRLLFNLLYFCAELHEPQILWSPLRQLTSKRCVPVPNHNRGEYQGVPLIAGLRAALAGNQAGDEMLASWCQMLEQKPDLYLDGAPMDGFEGVLGLPDGPREVLVGWALARMSEYLGDSPFRVRQFKQLLALVKSRFPGFCWDFELLAARSEWRRWAQRLVGNPEKLVKIEYLKIPEVRYLRGRNKPKIRIQLPLEYKAGAAKLDPTIRQLALDFCKEPPPDGTLVCLIEHLLPSHEFLLKTDCAKATMLGSRRAASTGFGPAVEYLRRNEAA
jgi:hypothetical protein